MIGSWRHNVATTPAPGIGSAPLVALERVGRVFDDGAIVALKSVDLAIPAGDCVAILGPSGSGKSSMVFRSRAARKAASRVWSVCGQAKAADGVDSDDG